MRLETVAILAPALNDAGLASSLRGLLDSAAATLLPHFAWEEQILFPKIDELVASPLATRLLLQQHAEVRRAIERLETVWLSLCRGCSRLEIADPPARLHGMRALLGSHLEQEEAILLTILTQAAVGEAPKDCPPDRPQGSPFGLLE